MEIRDDKRSVHEIAQELRELNGLNEKTLNVRYDSYHELIYAGDIKELKLPEGYYCDEHHYRGVTKPCITNRGNTASGMYRTFVVCTC